MGLLLLSFAVCAFAQEAEDVPLAVAAAKIQWQRMFDRGEQALEDGEFVKAEKIFRAADDLARSKDLPASYVGFSQADLGWSLRDQRRYEEAEPSFREALKYLDGAEGVDRQLVLNVKTGLGFALVGQGRYDDAEPLLLATVDEYNKMPKLDSCHLFGSLDALTMLYTASRQFSKGEHIYTEVFGLMTANKATPCRNYSALLDDLAQLYSDDNDWEKVEEVQKGRADLAMSMKGVHSELYGDAIFGLAQSYEKRRRFDEAAKGYAQAAEIFRSCKPEPTEKAAQSLTMQELSLLQAGRTKEANDLHSKVIAAVQHDNDNGDPRGRMMDVHSQIVEDVESGKVDSAAKLVLLEIAIAKHLTAEEQMIAYSDSAWVNGIQRKTVEQEADLKKQLSLAIASKGPKSRATANAYFELGGMYANTSRMEEAEEAWSKSLSLYGPHEVEKVKVLEAVLTHAYMSESKFDKAEPLVQRSIKSALETHDDLGQAMALVALGGIYQKTNRVPQAEPLFLKAMSLTEKLPKPMNSRWIPAALSTATYYSETGRAAQAEQTYLRVVTFIENEFGRDAWNLKFPLTALVNMMQAQGRGAEAAQYQARIDQLPPQPGH